MADPVPPAAPPRPLWLRLVGPAVIAALMGLAWANGLHAYLSLASLAEHRETLRAFTTTHAASALLLFILIYAAAVSLSLPGASALTITGGLLFGWLAGGLAAVLAATLGAVVIFLIARSSLGDVLARRAGPALNRLKEGFAADAFNYLLFLRLVPLFPFWLVNIAPALANMRLRTFAAATTIGIIPGTFAFAFVGEGLDSVIAAQATAHAACVAAKGAENCAFELSVSSLVTAKMLMAFAALGLAALVPVGLKKWKGGK